MGRAGKALALKKNYNCAQAVLMAFCRDYGLDADIAAELAFGFGGGIGGLQYTCGALTGAVMVAGLKIAEDKTLAGNKKAGYQKVKDLVARFKKENGAIDCADILGFDLSNEAGKAAAIASGHMASVCNKAVRTACEILEKM